MAVTDVDYYFSGPYADGCEVSPSCFTCPLPECKYAFDGPTQQRLVALVHALRVEAVMEQEGLSLEEAAGRLGIPRQTVRRRLRRLRAAREAGAIGGCDLNSLRPPAVGHLSGPQTVRFP